MGGSAGAAQFGRHVLPAAAGGQDEPQGLDDAPVVDRRASTGGADGPLGRQVVRRQVEECLGHPGNGHDRSLLRGGDLYHRSKRVPG